MTPETRIFEELDELEAAALTGVRTKVIVARQALAAAEAQASKVAAKVAKGRGLEVPAPEDQDRDWRWKTKASPGGDVSALEVTVCPKLKVSPVAEVETKPPDNEIEKARRARNAGIA